MDQMLIGSFIAKKRREKNLTQAALAERLGVSNKTISKWETGKCLPDYSLVEPLCRALDISVSELLDGEDKEESSVRVYDESQMLDLLRRIQVLEQQRTVIGGVLLIVMGLALFAAHGSVGGSDILDFFSGLMMGVSCALMMVGAYVSARDVFARR